MRIDVSEIKEYRNCRRKWSYSSRNKFHLTPLEQHRALAFGTIFHELLHKMYMGEELTDLYSYIESNLTDAIELKVMLSMIEGYYSTVLFDDLDQYQILNIEQGFSFPITADINLCGSIDMIALELETGLIYGFEHKSAKSFKDALMIRMDEQLRVYSVALRNIIADYNRNNGTDYGYGGLYLNEVRKLQKKFEHSRVLCKYTERDLEKFMAGIVRVAHRIEADALNPVLPDPECSPMKCIMCSYSSICEKHGYEDLTVAEILETLPDTYKVREMDHLDEKANRNDSEE